MAEAPAAVEKPSLSTAQIAQMTGVVTFLVLLVLLLYTFCHEGGHAILGLLFGGRVTAFNVNFFNLSAHVDLDGSFSAAQHAWISAAGVSLPLILGMLLTVLSPRRGNAVWTWFRLLAFIVPVSSLLAWVVIPILVQAGQTVGDDSAAFLEYTHFPPLLVGGAALFLFLACWAVFLRRSGGAQALRGDLSSQAVDLALPAARRTLLRLVGVGILFGAATLALTYFLPGHAPQVPPGYYQVASIDLSLKAYAQESVYRFKLDRPAKAGFYVTLENVRGGPLAIRLTGQEVYESLFFADSTPDLNAGWASVHPQGLPLAAGDYQVLLDAPHSRGKINIYAVVE